MAGTTNDVIAEPATYDFLGIPFFEGSSLLQLLLRFGFNLLVCWVIVQFFYYKKSGRRDFYFTFLLFSVTVFLLIFLLDNVKLQIGFALGLFAIFGMIRYRTETVPIREMTYLFVTIGISVINGLAMTVSYSELIITNLLFIGVTWLLESNKVLKHTAYKVILYEKIQLIVPERENELLEDLRQRTGLKITKVEVGNVDFLRDVAYIKVYYVPKTPESATTANQLKPLDF
jgi:signal transduction histidine kinase